jgi:hypothetical protein
MANLKLDLQNRLNNQKFFAELELVRLAQEPAMNYEHKIEQMDVQLQALAVVNGKIGLVDQYFQEPAPGAAPGAPPAPQAAPGAPPVAQAPQAAPAPAKEPVAQAPAAKVHKGQSHSE